MVTDAIFLCICIIGMTGAEEVTHVFIILAPLIIITYQETYWASCSSTFKDTAEDFHTVLLLACRGETALPRATACQFALDKVHVHGDACRHAVDYTSYGFAMAFAEGGQTEYVAKCVHQ